MKHTLVNKMSITKGYSPPTAAPTMHDTFLDVIGSNSATFLNKDANLLMFETITNMHCLILALCSKHICREKLCNEGINVN